MPRLPVARHLSAAALALGLLRGCSDRPPPAADGLDAGPARDLGRPDATDLGPDPTRRDAAPGPTADRRRLPLGATFYLPPGDGWALAQAPAGNLNAVFRDAGSGRSAFVAHLPGDHRFTRAAEAVSVTAVEAGSLAFHNLDYFPTRAVAATADLLFVASVLRPEVLAVNPADLTAAFAVPVGSWPVAVAPLARGALLVACRGEDALTVVDLATRRAVRSVWVGDEVSNVAVTPDGATAIALLPHDRQAVLLRTADWAESARLDVGGDPHHLAVRPDGASVFVAGRRTGDADDGGPDLAEIDLAARTVTRTVQRVGTTLGGIALGADGRSLYVTALRNDPAASLTSEFAPHFRHTVVRYDVSPGAPIRETMAAELTRSRPSPAGPAGDAGAALDGGAAGGLDARRVVGLHWVGERDGSVWVVAEASDLVLRLDAATLVERERFEAPGRPRAGAFAADGTVLVWGHQGQRLTAVRPAAGARAAVTSAPLARDPRPAAVARGQGYFTGTGMRADLGGGRVVAGDVWSCSSCHADGLTDRLAWQVGPVAGYRALSPALTLLEGTGPLGWRGGYGDLGAAAYTLHEKIGVLRPTQEQVDGLAAYLGSIAPPPAASTLTERDGAPSAEARRGAAHFEATCAGCHPPPLYTSRARVDRSLDDAPGVDVPSLVGTARHGAWLRTGARSSLAGAVDAFVAWTRAPLDAAQRGDLTRFVAELTGREFFAAAERPPAAELLPTTSAIALDFSQPVSDRADNLARVQLTDPSGRAVVVRHAVEGRRLVLTPATPLLFGAGYRVVVDEGFESELEVRTARPQTFVFRTVDAPALRVSGAYAVTWQAADPRGGPAAPARLALTLSSDGGGLVSVVATFAGAPLTWRGAGSISGRRLRLPPVPLLVGDTFAVAASGFEGELGDLDADGTGDLVVAGARDGGVRGFTVAGTGYELRDVPWGLARAGQ